MDNYDPNQYAERDSMERERRRKQLLEEIKTEADRRERQGKIIKFICYIFIFSGAILYIISRIMIADMKSPHNKERFLSSPLAIELGLHRLVEKIPGLLNFKPIYWDKILKNDKPSFVTSRGFDHRKMRAFAHSNAKSDNLIKVSLKSHMKKNINLFKEYMEGQNILYTTDAPIDEKIINLEVFNALYGGELIFSSATEAKSAPNDSRPYLLSGLTWLKYYESNFKISQELQAIAEHTKTMITGKYTTTVEAKMETSYEILLAKSKSQLSDEHKDLLYNATDDLEKAASLNSNSHIIYYYLAACYYYNGSYNSEDYDKALENLKKSEESLNKEIATTKNKEEKKELTNFIDINHQAVKMIETQKELNLSREKPFKTVSFIFYSKKYESNISTKLDFPVYIRPSQLNYIIK